MRRLHAAPLAMTVLLASGIGGAGCGRGEGSGAPEIRTTVAGGLSLVRAAAPDDRQLQLRYVAGALLWTPDPIARVEVDQTPAQILVRLFINERIPAPDERVPNYATIRTTTIQLDRAVGKATVLDASATPPVPMPVR
jgi:hypothetical protein